MKTTTYKEEYCQQLIDHMSQGKSFQSFGAKVRAGRTTLYDWTNKFPEFKEAREIGQAAALDFFETRLILKASGTTKKTEGINIKAIDTGATIFPLKTRFHEVYGEKQHLSIGGDDSKKAIKLSYSLDDED